AYQFGSPAADKAANDRWRKPRRERLPRSTSNPSQIEKCRASCVREGVSSLTLQSRIRLIPLTLDGTENRCHFAAIAEVPTLRSAHRVQLLHRQAVTCKPRLGPAFDDLIDLPDAVRGFAAREAFAGRRSILLEILLPESPTAQHAAGSARNGHLHLLFVGRKIDAGAQQHPGTLRGGVQLAEIVHQFVLALFAQPAGELGLVDVAVATELPRTLDHRLGLALKKALAVFFFSAERKSNRLQEHQNVVLLTFRIDLLNKTELMLGAFRLGRLELGK